MARQQDMLIKAIEQVRTVQGEAEKTKQSYGGLCHRLPVLVRTCGLCQALAFVHSKKGTKAGREKACLLMFGHISELLQQFAGIPIDSIMETVASLPAEKYILSTRLLLNGFVYHKRFAESILDVKAGTETQE